jgi:hypothetical protein
MTLDTMAAQVDEDVQSTYDAITSFPPNVNVVLSRPLANPEPSIVTRVPPMPDPIGGDTDATSGVDPEAISE